MKRTLAIAVVELRRFLADRSNIFFVFLFPLLLVLLIGSAFGGGGATRVAMTAPDSALRTELTAQLERDGVDVTVVDGDGMRELVARGRAAVGILVPDRAAEAYDDGADLAIQLVHGNQAQSPVAAQQVMAAVEALAVEQGKLGALTAAGADAADARAALSRAEVLVEPPRLAVVNISEIAQEFAGLGQFDYGAASQLLLFVFLISLAGSETLISARRHGVVSRTMAAPVSTAQVVGGQALGRLTIGAFQGAYIMAATMLLFGVDWGNLALALLVMVVFALVAAGAAMILGSVLDNDAAASGVGVGLGLVLAALGGGMYPVELFPDTLRTVSKFTPHAWGYDAFAQIQRHDGGLVDILPQLGVLLGFAALFLLIGSWALRRSLARAI